MTRRRVYVVGVGMTKFEKPGRRSNFDYPDMTAEAVGKALKDANLQIRDVEAACVGYVYGDSTCGQRAIYEIGMTGIPIFNVNNNCSTGSSALMLAKLHVEAGSDCVLALGFEKMERGSLTSKFNDRTNPMEKHVEKMATHFGFEPTAPVTAQMFGYAGREHMQKYGTKPEHFAKIAEKNHRHSANNPNSQFQDIYSLEQILQSPKIFDPLTKLQCCPTSDGAAAAIVCSENFVVRHGLFEQAIEILGMEMVTDFPSSFAGSAMSLVGYDMTKAAADRLYAKTGIKPSDVHVVELHDCFSANELITYEALGLCGPGEAGKFIDSKQNTYGGRCVVNPSGGLISKGHPLGATGLAQCTELCLQLRGLAEKRQVPDARIALQHNIGLGGASIVALYRKGFTTRNSGIVRNNVAASASARPEDFKANKLFLALEKAMKEDSDNLIEKVRGIFAIKVKNGAGGKDGYWVINAKTGKGSVEFNGKSKPDVTFLIDDNDVTDLLTGKLNPQKAFFQGKVKIQGNMGLAMKLQELQRLASGRIEEIRSKL
ncbi:Nonspecific lipid-transfer protein, putative [Pediculus humanus corporis]|uniref:Sterol carrier protein 2 n=1 Tax=Pediculus humanus subsp. corporis TaxID=121224 RepID=E0VAE7_PEDHC|nr:Nonspecific lipid-transfer protein, putative [Pediculus humanus corporis]EEB10353.1 Nonspecific lipid-transfer protein, putative [Pediculus humanus corporis]